MNTKQTICHIILLAAISMQMSACKKYLDYQSPSRLNLEQVYESVEYTNSALLGVYNKAAGRNVYGGNLPTVFPLGADEFWQRGSASYDPTASYAISTYGASGMNSLLYNTFVQLYEGIERANIACKNIPASNIYRTGSADQKLKLRRYYGEALALRALFYFELLHNWGDVPATFEPAADRASQFFSHANRDSTYDRIIEDLRIASELVGWRSEVTEYKSYRLTKGAIKAIRARVALFRGGYSLRTDSRQMQRRNDYLKYYRIAMEECASIIASKQHQLNPVYENIFKSLHSGTARFDDQAELMFEIAMWGGINDSDLSRTYGLGFTNSDPWGGGGGGARAVPTYFYEFANGIDVRRDITLANFEVKDGANKNQTSLINFMCGKFRKSWTQFDKNSPSLTFGVNWPVIRYADVLLMYAEAANELQETAEGISAIDALEQVQRRAYGTNPIPVNATDKDGLFKAIVQERLLEFGGEGLRKHDLIRWNLLATKINEVKENLKLMAVNAPIDNNRYANYPDYIYFKWTPFRNGTYKDETATLDLYGGKFDSVYYIRTTVNPGGTWRSAWWRRELGVYTNGVLTSGDFITHANTGYMNKFEANKKELLPYPDRVILENRGAIQQNFGYVQ